MSVYGGYTRNSVSLWTTNKVEFVVFVETTNTMLNARSKSLNRDYDRVAFDRGFLRAAIEASERSEADIAKSVGVKQQNIDYMLSEKTAGTCGRTLRRNLAAQLNIPLPLLAGGANAIERWVEYALGGDILWGPPQGAWAALNLLHLVLKTADKRRFIAPRRFKLVYSVGALLRPVTWQQRLTGVERLGNPEAAGATVALAKGLRFALQPWLSGEAELDLAELFAMARPKLKQHNNHPYPPPTSVFRKLSSVNELFEGAPEELDLTKYLGDK